MAVLTGAFLRFKLSRVLRHTNGRDGSPIKNDYSFLINRNKLRSHRCSWDVLGGLSTLSLVTAPVRHLVMGARAMVVFGYVVM